MTKKIVGFTINLIVITGVAATQVAFNELAATYVDDYSPLCTMSVNAATLAFYYALGLLIQRT